MALLLMVAFVYVSNTSLLAKRLSGPPTALAHRGIAQQFDSMPANHAGGVWTSEVEHAAGALKQRGH